MKRVGLVISALVVVALVWVVVARPGHSDSHVAVDGSVPVAVPVAEPSDSEPATTLPPADAAAAAVAATGDVVMAGLITRRDLIASFTTADFGPELADVTSQQVTEMRLAMTETGRSPAGLSAVEFPLRTRTLSRDETTATVEVWSLLVIASADEPVARQAWRTVTVDLQLVEDRWLVDGWESADGPTPASPPHAAVASSGEVAGRLEWAEVG